MGYSVLRQKEGANGFITVLLLSLSEVLVICCHKFLIQVWTLAAQSSLIKCLLHRSIIVKGTTVGHAYEGWLHTLNLIVSCNKLYEQNLS